MSQRAVTGSKTFSVVVLVPVLALKAFSKASALSLREPLNSYPPRPALAIATASGDWLARILPNCLNESITGFISEPEVTHAETESRMMLARMNPGSLVTKFRSTSAGAARTCSHGIRGTLRPLNASKRSGSSSS